LSRLQLLCAALLFSTGGAAIKAVSLGGWQVACYRSGVAALVLLALVPGVRRDWNWRVPLVGLAYAMTLVLFVLSNKLTTAANAIFLQSTAPLYLLLLGPWLLKEPVRRSDLILVAIVGAGMSLFFLGGETALSTAPHPFRGNVVALIAGITWALTLAGVRWIGSRQGGGQAGLATVVAGNALACLVCLPKALPPVSFPVRDVLIIGYLGAFQIGLAYVFLTRAMRVLPALEASLLLLAEPALSPIWAALVHGERPAPLAILGGALILSATLARILLRR
jgi:drug/metabolite transporter, DME family